MPSRVMVPPTAVHVTPSKLRRNVKTLPARSSWRYRAQLNPSPVLGPSVSVPLFTWRRMLPTQVGK
jgi:hypothetical protein